MHENDNSKSITVFSIAGAVLLVAVGAAAAIYALVANTPTVQQASHEHGVSAEHVHSEDVPTEAPIASTKAPAITIEYANDGFTAVMYTVQYGQMVRVENNSANELYFTTGDHHNHDIHSPLSLGVIAPGEASSFVAPQPGRYGFHNHENEHQAGELIVQ